MMKKEKPKYSFDKECLLEQIAGFIFAIALALLLGTTLMLGIYKAVVWAMGG